MRAGLVIAGTCLSLNLLGCGTSDSQRADRPASAQATSAALLGTGERSAAVDVETLLWPDGGQGGLELLTPHYRILTNVRNPVIRDRLPTFLEDALLHYRSAFDRSRLLPEPAGRMQSYVMADRPGWAQVTSENLPPSRARRYLQIERGGFAEGGVGYLFDIGTQDTFAIAAHEGWHQYTQTTFAGRLPQWLEEGCATYCEGFRWSTAEPDRAVFSAWSNVERFDRLRDAHRAGTLMDLPTLLSAEPAVLLAGSMQATLDYYAQLWALMHFLREGADGRYRSGLMQALQDAAAGRLRRAGFGAMQQRVTGARSFGERVFQIYMNENIAIADAEYRAFVDRVVAPGSKQLIVAGQSPLR